MSSVDHAGPSTCLVGTATTGANDTTVASRAYVVATYPLERRTTTLEASGYLTASDDAGIYLLGNGRHAVKLGTNGSAYVIPFEYIDTASESTIIGKTFARFLRVSYSVNDVAPDLAFSVKLYRIRAPQAPATSGGANEVRYEVAETMTLSECLISSPAADAFATVTSSDFGAYISNGFYAIGVSIEGTLPLACHVQFNACTYTAHV